MPADVDYRVKLTILDGGVDGARGIELGELTVLDRRERHITMSVGAEVTLADGTSASILQTELRFFRTHVAQTIVVGPPP